MFVESITQWEKSEYGSVKQQKLYKGDMVDMEDKKYMHLLNYSRHHLDNSVTTGRHSNFQLYTR